MRTVEKVGGTLKGVAESGFIWTIGAIRTTPAKSLGLSQATRMDMAPPCTSQKQRLATSSVGEVRNLSDDFRSVSRALLAAAETEPTQNRCGLVSHTDLEPLPELKADS